MPEHNTRIVVVGAPRADKAFDIVSIARGDAEKLAQQLEKESARAVRDIERQTRELEREVRHGQ